MHVSLLDILRCPYCGGRLELVTSTFHRRDGDEIHDAVLGCHCCTFPIVAGIPVMHLDGAAKQACAHVDAGHPERARRAMFNVDDDAAATRLDTIVSSETATYQDIVEALGLNLEGGYFFYRFSDPTYLVAHALVRAVASTVLRGGGRAIDVCGGSGHLTRALMDLSSRAPVLADLYFSKIWLARRFIAPGCEAVCCDGNGPLPFARGAFRYAMCTDAFMFIWQKRQAVQELLRLVDGRTDGDRDGRGTVVISHAHNQRVWSPSHGQPLPPEGYRDLFETIEPRLFGEAGLFADVLRGGPLDLARLDSSAALDRDPALVCIATPDDAVFRAHALDASPGLTGELRLNPLYRAEPTGDRVRLRLTFPSVDYEEEFGACREYLPEEVVVDRAALVSLGTGVKGSLPAAMADLIRRRVLLDLPQRYY
jgi:uncharacterized protein YbaR (Trm112 family)